MFGKSKGQDHLLEYQALEAWLSIEPSGRVPQQITPLKVRPNNEKKSAVYRLEGVGPGGTGVVAKRCGIDDGHNERLIYQEILARIPISAPRLLGFFEDWERSCCWLFIENVDGVQYSPNNRCHQRLTAEWLAQLHTQAQYLGKAQKLPAQDAARYLNHLKDARQRITNYWGNEALSYDDRIVLGKILAQFDILESQWPIIETEMRKLPSTLVHGDFVGKNMRIRQHDGQIHLFGFDWEKSGWGFPGIDFGSMREFDAELYWQTARELGLELDVNILLSTIPVSQLLRSLAAVDWGSFWLEFEWVEHIMRNMRLYEAIIDNFVNTKLVAA